MVSRDDMGSWLDGGPGGDDAGRESGLGLPGAGPGSRAGVGRRIVALCVDWFVCWLVNYLVVGMSSGRGFLDVDGMVTLAVFAIENVLLVGTVGFTVGHRLLGMRVRRLASTNGAVGVGRAAVRTLLLCLVIPAVVWDSDGRGLHDRAAGTLIVRL